MSDAVQTSKCCLCWVTQQCLDPYGARELVSAGDCSPLQDLAGTDRIVWPVGTSHRQGLLGAFACLPAEGHGHALCSYCKELKVETALLLLLQAAQRKEASEVAERTALTVREDLKPLRADVKDKEAKADK